VADLAAFTTDMTAVVTAGTTMFTNVLEVFTQAPLSYFLGLTVFGFVLRKASRMIRGRT
jgi:hypothetical protein